MNQNTLRIGMQGELGSNHHLLSRQLYPDVPDTHIHPAKSFTQLCDALESGEIDIALMAIENSIAGSIHHNYDLLSHRDFHIIGEGFVPIRHHLIGIPNARIEDIRVVYSHEMALLQCKKFIQSHNLDAHIYFDTAAAVELVMTNGDIHTAAIAPALAATLHNASVLASDIADTDSNVTRFLVLSKESVPSSPDSERKIMLEYTLHHHRGTLAKVLAILASADANCTKIESRPIPDRPWEHRFFTDCCLTASNLELNALFESLCEHTITLRVHGIFSSKQEVAV